VDPRAGVAASCVMLLSGAATLVLEIVWVRQLGLALGRTHAALSTVTAAFLAGLAGGAYLSVRCARARPALIQAHLAAGVLGVLFPALVRALEAVLAVLAGWLGGGSHVFGLVSHALAAALVLVPAMLLGSALPLVLRIRGDARTGWFSGVSAAGAAAGALATGFLLLPRLGNAATARTGALIALAAAAFAALLEETGDRSPESGVAAVRAPDSGLRTPDSALLLLATVGALAMLLELSFVRYFTLMLGSTTFALALILAGFIAGSSAGSLTADRIMSFARRRNLTASSWPGVSAVLAGVAVIALVPVLGRLPVWLVSLHSGSLSFDAQQLALFAVTTLTMLVPAMALGAVFPLAVATAPKRPGALIAASTSGSVAGTLAWGAFVLPVLGLQRTLVACALALIGSGTAWCSGRLAGVAVTALALLAVQAFIPTWKPHVMAAGVHHYSNVYAQRARQLECSMDAALESFGRILAYRDGPDGSVAVRQQADGTRSLVIDGKADASTMGDMRTQRLLGHLPALLGPGRRGLVIGLGSGVTLGSLLSYGFERVDVVELSRDVVHYAPFFSADSRAPLADPRAHVVVQDARALLARPDARWDVITSEPRLPSVPGRVPRDRRGLRAHVPARDAVGVHARPRLPADRIREAAPDPDGPAARGVLRSRDRDRSRRGGDPRRGRPALALRLRS
jgi:spermidine synthase